MHVSTKVKELGFRYPGNFCLWNPQSLVLESRIQLKKSGIPQKIGIQDSIFTYKDWNPRRGIQNRRLSGISLQGAKRASDIGANR